MSRPRKFFIYDYQITPKNRASVPHSIALLLILNSRSMQMFSLQKIIYFVFFKFRARPFEPTQLARSVEIFLNLLEISSIVCPVINMLASPAYIINLAALDIHGRSLIYKLQTGEDLKCSLEEHCSLLA